MRVDDDLYGLLCGRQKEVLLRLAELRLSQSCTQFPRKRRNSSTAFNQIERKCYMKVGLAFASVGRPASSIKRERALLRLSYIIALESDTSFTEQ